MSEDKRAVFVTIGQSPRSDVVPEMLAYIGAELKPHQVGALDGLTPAEIAALAPQGEEHRLVTRLRDGSEVVISKARTRDRLQAILDDLDGQKPDLIVLLCTGYFENLHCKTLMVEAQRAVDRTVEALAGDGRTIGVMVPLAEQMGEFHAAAFGESTVRMAYASPYSGQRFAEAAHALSDTDLIVMHCMGYTEAMRHQVAELSGKPVLLARRMLASMVAQML